MTGEPHEARTRGVVLIDALFAAGLFVTVALPLSHAWVRRAERRSDRRARAARQLELIEWRAFQRLRSEPGRSVEIRPGDHAEARVRVEIVRGEKVEWIVISDWDDPRIRVQSARLLGPDSL